MSNILSDPCLQFLRWLLVTNDTCLELEDEYGLKLSGRSSTIQINTELWNKFTLDYIERKIQDYLKKPTQPDVEEVRIFTKLEKNSLNFVKEPFRSHILDCYRELDKKDIEYKLLENNFIKLREAKRSLQISNTRLR